MSVDWHTFKSALGRNTSVTYIDEEDSEIPIDSECEFQEALRLARLSKTPLRVIVSDKLQPSQKRYISVNLPEENSAGKTKMSAMSNTFNLKETCHCSGDGAPEWFTHYMKKFKKELFNELKSYIHDSIHSTIENEKKLIAAKSNAHDLQSEKNDCIFPVSTQIKKKKKSEKDSGDILHQREAKLQRKLEKLHTTKSERLEKLDNKMRILFEEKRRLLERKRHSSPKLDKILMGGSEKKKLKKSVFFRKNNVFLFLSPGSVFVLKVLLINDGKLPWSYPRLEFFDVSGLYPEESSVSLPRLNPTESYTVTLKGKASKSAGLHHFKCRVVDGLEPLLPEFTCRARVDVFVWDDEKSEENIIEIQRMLQDVDLRRSTEGEGNVRNNGKRGNGKGGKGKTGCDLLQGLEAKEKSWKERLEEEKVLLGVDCLAPTASEGCNLKTDEEKENETADSFEKVKTDPEGEQSCDSDGSIIFMSEEEDENFVMIPSKSLSPAESVNEVSVSQTAKKEFKATTCNEQPEATEVLKPGAKKETKPPKEEIPIKASPLECGLLAPTRSPSPHGEEIFKPKKIKSKSTEYHFTAENLTQPTFAQFPEGIFEPKFSNRPSTFKFTAGKEETPQKDKSEKREDRRRKKVPRTDALGRVIYAVNSNGCCLPMEEVLQQDQAPPPIRGKRAKNDGGGGRENAEPRFYPHNQDRRSDRSNEIPAVNILPNALMNGASNVATLAFNTAKSVLNNLQFAFVTEGKTESKTHDFRAFETAMCKLYDMGFPDFQLNEELLRRHSNNLTAVVEELVRMQEQSKNGRPQ